MITTSFKKQGTNCLYKFFLEIQSNQNRTFWVNKIYINLAATDLVSKNVTLFESTEQRSGMKYVWVLIVKETKV